MGILDMTYQDVMNGDVPKTPARNPMLIQKSALPNKPPAPLPTPAVSQGSPVTQAQGAANPMLAASPAGISVAQAAKSPATSASAVTVDDGHGGIYTPGGGAIPPDQNGILSGIGNLLRDSAQAARSGVHYDQVKANRIAGETPAAIPVAALPAAGSIAGFAPQDPFGANGNPMAIKPTTDGQFMTGKAQYDATGLNKTGVAAPDSSGGGFTDKKGVSYNVNESSQDGIAKVTATGKNPLYTNIRPEDAVAGLKNQTIGGDAASVQEGIDRFARANAITQSIIDKQPMGGVGILGDGGVEAANAEKTARWRQDELLDKSRSMPAAGQVANALAQGQSQQIIEAMRQQGIMSGQQVAMRGQDMAAASDANRVAGSPEERALKQAQAGGIMAHTESAQAIAELQKKAAQGDQQAAATLQAINGKARPASDRYLTVQGGEEIGPDGMTKIKRPGGVFDAQTQRFVPMDGAKQGNSFSRADVDAALKAGADKAKIAERIKSVGGNPADFGL